MVVKVQYLAAAYDMNFENKNDKDEQTVLFSGITNDTGTKTLLEKNKLTGQEMNNTGRPQEFAEEAHVEERSIYIDKGSTKLENNVDKLNSQYLDIKQATAMTSVFDSLIHVDTGITYFSDKKLTKGTSNTNYQDKNVARKHMACKSTPSLTKHSVKPTGNDQQQENPTHPGAMAMFPGGNDRQVLTPMNNDISFLNADHHDALATTVVNGASGVEGGGKPTLQAFLVNDHNDVVASATILDVEAEEKKNQRRRMRTILGSFITASIIATAVAVPVVLTRSASAQTFVGSPTSSPIPSAVPSSTPTSSPSTSLFGFLAANSFDGGSALDIPGSPQQMALDWLVNVSGIFEMDYHLLQNYALVTFYFETAGQQWISTEEFDFMHSVQQSATVVDDEKFRGEWLNVTSNVNPLGFCDWQGVVCNGNQEIDSLMLSGTRLKGSIPAELGILHKSLSKSFKMCTGQKTFAASDMHIMRTSFSSLYPHLFHFV